VAVVSAGAPGAVLLGHRCRGDAQGELEWRIEIPAFSIARNSSSVTRCFSGSSRPARASENGSCFTSVDVVYGAVEWLGSGCTGLQQRRELFDQLLYLGLKGGHWPMAVSGHQGLMKEAVLVFEKVRPEA
jgi:hypothetical protein